MKSKNVAVADRVTWNKGKPPCVSCDQVSYPMKQQTSLAWRHL
jgi:hypothetical protein